jgi:murein tripeptide amidase MpaA
VEYLQVLSDRFPQYVTLIDSIGLSVEGRKIPALKITNSTATGPKRAIFWNGGQHAREWVSPSTVLYLAHQLVTQTTNQVSEWLQKVDFYIIPIQNPDGYHFTQVKNRMWRKNRRKNKNGSFGVDLNRNWDEHFGVIGTSNNPSDETYRGPFAFSEPETKAVADFILSISNRYAGIDFHASIHIVTYRLELLPIDPQKLGLDIQSIKE